jgi:hypothetical protein
MFNIKCHERLWPNAIKRRYASLTLRPNKLECLSLESFLGRSNVFEKGRVNQAVLRYKNVICNGKARIFRFSIIVEGATEKVCINGVKPKQYIFF